MPCGQVYLVSAFLYSAVRLHRCSSCCPQHPTVGPSRGLALYVAGVCMPMCVCVRTCVCETSYISPSVVEVHLYPGMHHTSFFSMVKSYLIVCLSCGFCSFILPLVGDSLIYFFKKTGLFVLVYANGCFVCMSVHRVCACCQQRPAEGIGAPAIVMTDVCEPPCGCWEPESSARASVLNH